MQYYITSTESRSFNVHLRAAARTLSTVPVAAGGGAGAPGGGGDAPARPSRPRQHPLPRGRGSSVISGRPAPAGPWRPTEGPRPGTREPVTVPPCHGRAGSRRPTARPSLTSESRSESEAEKRGRHRQWHSTAPRVYPAWAWTHRTAPAARTAPLSMHHIQLNRHAGFSDFSSTCCALTCLNCRTCAAILLIYSGAS
jgi:hypothetical protein